jgi:hypothetical protein
VRVRPQQVGLRTVGAEIGEALAIAVPVAFFWVGLHSLPGGVTLVTWTILAVANWCF